MKLPAPGLMVGKFSMTSATLTGTRVLATRAMNTSPTPMPPFLASLESITAGTAPFVGSLYMPRMPRMDSLPNS